MSPHENVAVDPDYLRKLVGMVGAYEEVAKLAARAGRQLIGLRGHIDRPGDPGHHRDGYIAGATLFDDGFLFLFMVTREDDPDEALNSKPWTRQ